jgi:putative ABC transport system ATP-binding protein
LTDAVENKPVDNLPDQREIVIEIENLKRSFLLGSREVAALNGVTLMARKGEFVGLKGRSGSGKSTLLNCIGGLDRPSSGSVRVFGQDLRTLSDDELAMWRRRDIGYVFQSFGLLPSLSAYENVELMLRLINSPIKERRERTLYCLELVGLQKWARHRPNEMSGGQQQRVGIARALANKPKLILADEPTGELDSNTAKEILGIFQRIVDQERVTLVVASHDPLVDAFADVVLQLKDGQVEDFRTA